MVSRQQAFEQLRGPCVELSSTALKFRARQSSVKNVSQALFAVSKVLRQLGDADALDHKLSEYAFFPFTHIFNEAQNLSSRCLELAVDSVSILVTKGWRQQLAPEMGKQLLILMTLIAGADSKKQLEPPSEELKSASYRCIQLLIEQLLARSDTPALFNDVGSKSVVDQLAYLLLESVSTDDSDQVQLAAAEAMRTLLSAITNRALLASLLPRTASSLAQSLRTSTKSRRTRKVLIAYLMLLTSILRAVLADSVVYALSTTKEDSMGRGMVESQTLDESWLRATSSQVHLVVVQTVKLRSHDSSDVRRALAGLCLTLISECPRSLSESLKVAVETLIHVAQHDEGAWLVSELETLIFSSAEIMDILMSKLYDWIQSIPRIMQASDDIVKQNLLGQIRISITVMAHTSRVSDDMMRIFTNKLLEGITSSENFSQDHSQRLLEAHGSVAKDMSLGEDARNSSFTPLIMNHSTQTKSLQQLELLLTTLHQIGSAFPIAISIIERIPEMSIKDKVSGIWLAMACLKDDTSQSSMLHLLDTEEDNSSISRPRLISELYGATLPSLLEHDVSSSDKDWRLAAMAIECTVSQANQLGQSYRVELVDTLYPLLSLLGTSNSDLRNHAMAGLNLLSSACKYSSTGDMLIENVDYLINAVGMKLNSFDVLPQAPQVLLMMLRLCGARIVPYIDDLIGSIFSALDNFHGYPELVELLFQVLRAVVDESKKQPGLAITNGLTRPDHQNPVDQPSELNDIVDDLRARSVRKRQKRETEREADQASDYPRNSFESEMQMKEKAGDSDASEPDGEQAAQSSDRDQERKLTKSHQLLLSIARSTTPHLSSPSRRVRSILLQMLDEVSPLLAQDENSFLPLINHVWPAIVPRLLDFHDDLTDAETSYNVCAAADTIATLCRDAGNFMSTRIEDIFPRLRKLFDQVQVSANSRSTVVSIAQERTALLPRASEASSRSGLRSPSSLILAALIRLLIEIISHVKLRTDTGDEIFTMLVSFSDGIQRQQVEDALAAYDEDAVWLWKQTGFPS